MQEGFTDRPIPPVSVTLIDGGLLLHSYLAAIGKITSYGNLARNLLSHVCGNEIHVLFDTYQLTLLKNNERQLHGAEDYPFVISGPEQGTRQSSQKLLQNGIFKPQLAIFLLKEWQKDQYGIILGKKRLVVSHGGNCVHLSYSNNNEKMVVGHPEQLQGNHEEADTLIAFHAVNATGNVVVRTSDTDALVILLGMIG